jgi:hypothetical protein
METPPRPHLFALTKSEQRVVILVMIALLAFALGKFYHGLSHRPELPPVGTAAPVASPAEEEPALDETR